MGTIRYNGCDGNIPEHAEFIIYRVCFAHSLVVQFIELVLKFLGCLLQLVWKKGRVSKHKLLIFMRQARRVCNKCKITVLSVPENGLYEVDAPAVPLRQSWIYLQQLVYLSLLRKLLQTA